ncbi:MAG: exopolysaccharide biosynthesis protein [Desulfosarcina sp.]
MSPDHPNSPQTDGHGPENLQQLIQRIETRVDGHHPVTLGQILEAVGQRSFGVWFLVAGLVTLAPLVGDIPGVPTLMALFVFLTASQLLLRRRHFWLPGWLRQRSVHPEKIDRSLRWMRPPARWIDRFLHPRLVSLVEGGAEYAIAGACLAIALLMPAMELVPFSANGAGAALSLFGLSLMSRDGLLAVVAYLFTLITFGALLFIFM